MGLVISFLVSVLSAVLNVVATLDITSAFWVQQPRCPKSLLK